MTISSNMTSESRAAAPATPGPAPPATPSAKTPKAKRVYTPAQLANKKARRQQLARERKEAEALKQQQEEAAKALEQQQKEQRKLRKKVTDAARYQRNKVQQQELKIKQQQLELAIMSERTKEASERVKEAKLAIFMKNANNRGVAEESAKGRADALKEEAEAANKRASTAGAEVAFEYRKMDEMDAEEPAASSGGSAGPTVVPPDNKPDPAPAPAPAPVPTQQQPSAVPVPPQPSAGDKAFYHAHAAGFKYVQVLGPAPDGQWEVRDYGTKGGSFYARLENLFVSKQHFVAVRNEELGAVGKVKYFLWGVNEPIYQVLVMAGSCRVPPSGKHPLYNCRIMPLDSDGRLCSDVPEAKLYSTLEDANEANDKAARRQGL